MRNAAGVTAVLLALAGAARAQEADPLPFEILRLNDTGGVVDVRFQLIVPPAKTGKPALDKIRGRLLQAFFPEEDHAAAGDPQGQMAAVQRRLLEEFDEAYGGAPAPTAQRWADHRSQRVLMERHGLVTIEQRLESYTGGAHGMEARTMMVFSARTGVELLMVDLFRPGAEAELTERIKARLREMRNAPPDTDLNTLGFWEKDIRPQNPFVTEKGVGFAFNAYDIAPYAMGSFEVKFTFAELRDLIRVDGPLAPFAP